MIPNYSTTVTTWVTLIALPFVPGFPALRHARKVNTFQTLTGNDVINFCNFQ